jgi:hypothetical protein
MTQPVFPSLLPQGPRVPMANVEQVPVAPAPGGPAAVPIDPQTGLSQAELEFRARRQAKLQAQAELEAKHGKVGTAARQLGRGALDALLAPGALAGALAEGAGYATGWEGLEDFGRDFGRASQGSELMATIASAPDALAYAGRRIAGDTEEEAIDADRDDARESLRDYATSVQKTREEEQAWPMLSAASRLAGAVAFGVGTGAAASHAGLATQAGAAAIEGAGFGAQTAYEKNAPLRDVVTSTLIGATLGGGLTVGVGKGVPYLREKAAGGLYDFARGRAVKSAVGGSKPAWKAITRGGKDPERAYRMGEKLLKRGVDIDDLDDTVRGINAEVLDAGTKLSTVSSTLDEAGVKIGKASGTELLEAADAQVAQLRKIGLGTFDNVANKLEDEIAGFRRRIESGGEYKFSEFWEFRQNFDKLVKFEKLNKSPAEEGMARLRDMVADTLKKAVDSADPSVGKIWREASEDYSDFITLKHWADDLALARSSNRTFSLTDYGVGGTVGLSGVAAAIGSGGAAIPGLIGSAALAAGGAAANKFARERGSGILARWAYRLSGKADDAGHTVSVAAAGGKEAQEAITKIERARIAIREAGERAGPNPTAQQAARQAAQAEVGERLAKEAGEFDANWIKKPPTTLQKVLHRSQILDQVSTDVSGAVQKVAALRPTLATPLAQRRIGKLLKDADGPAAIGGMQMRLGKLMEQLPRSVEGETLRGALKAYSQQLRTAGTAETMRTAHDLVLRFSQAAQVAADPSVKAFSARAAADIAQDLSGPAWGTAGQHYARLSKAPSDALAALSDPAALRDALRTVELRGKLSGAARDGMEALRQAQAAASELTGAKPTFAEAQLKAVERLFEQAEEAVTLDGGPVGRVLEYFARKQDERVAGSLGAHVTRGLGDQPGSAVEGAVAHAVKSRLAKLGKVLHTAGHTAQHAGIHTAQSSAIGAATGAEGKAASKAARPMRAAAALGMGGAAVGGRTLLTPQEKQQQFKMRSEQLAAIVRDPDTDISEGLSAIHAIAPGLDSLAAQDFREIVERLEQEAPKMKMGFRGPEMPSRQDVQRFHALFEGVTDPLSVFDDFVSGAVDYDKVQAAWRYYPGLKMVSQMALQDIFYSQMGDAERAQIPESMLSQLDHLFGMEGALQPTLAASFVQTVDAVAAQAASKQKPSAKKPLELPAQEPSFTQRLSGAGR